MYKDDSADPNENIEDIVPVDYVWRDKTLVEAVDLGVYFDYLVASHATKHVPDVIGWFGRIPAALKASEVLSLEVPDKRFTFDCQRDVSGASEFIDFELMHLFPREVNSTAFYVSLRKPL